MESLTRSLNFELPHGQQFDTYAQQVLENGHGAAHLLTAPSLAALQYPTIATTTAAALAASTSASASISAGSSDFLQKLGATLINSIQLQQLRANIQSHSASQSASASASGSTVRAMDMEFAPNHVVIDSSSFDGLDELQKQLEYDKFMNEIWIGIVLTLILISMVFCICSCFLYHQFKTWKRNYRSTIIHSQAQDIEAVKLRPDIEDPVPEYTLVSGLPTYEAALELLNKTSNACILVYPSVYNVFGANERTPNELPATHSALSALARSASQQHVVEQATPLLAAAGAPTAAAPNGEFEGPPSYVSVAISANFADAKPFPATTTTSPTPPSPIHTTTTATTTTAAPRKQSSGEPVTTKAKN